MKLLAGLLMVSVAGAAAAANDAALLGCWRSQQVQVTLADHSHRDQIGD